MKLIGNLIWANYNIKKILCQPRVRYLAENIKLFFKKLVIAYCIF